MPDPVTVPPEAITAAAQVIHNHSRHGTWGEECVLDDEHEIGVIEMTVAENVLYAAAPLIAAAERERQRSLLPYHIPCCDRFADAVADLINEHEDTP